jgi:dipeptidyl-peptidase-4
MRRVLTAVLALVPLALVEAQTAKQLTIEAIYGGELSAPSPSQIRWTPDGNISYFLSGSGGRDLWLYDTASGERTILVGASELREIAPSPSQATEDERERTRRTRFGVPDYHWAPDGASILFTSSGRVLVYDLATSELAHLAPSKENVLDPKYSPDGSSIAFVYEHDIWVVPADGGDERQLTFGGTDLILHGELDWVYPEELGVRTGYHWSPDGRHIAYLELDETLVPTYPITDLVGRQATVDLQRYPKPGDPNPRVRAGIVNVASATTAWIDRADEYIPRIDWKNGDTVAIQLLNRGQDRLELIHVDAKTGRSRSIRTETDPHWINVPRTIRFLDDGGFLWTSERTGFRHLYLHDDDGRVIRPLTEGEWQVAGLAGVDESRGLVYFTGNRDNPIGADLYQVALDGSGLKRLTHGRGTHQIAMNATGDAYLDRYQSMLEPGGTTFHDVATGSSAAFHQGPSLDDYALVTPEWKLLDAPDGAKVGLLLMKPHELEPGKKYPLVAYVYGMPGFGTIRDSWGGSRFLFHQFLVQQGYVVAQIDDRTAAVWGHQYATLGDHNIGPLAVEDHAVAVEYLTGLPYVDAENMAVWGWSGGGFTTTFHMTHTDLFKIGIAGAPVTDWHLYDSIYTERYMGVPAEDPEAYQRTSSVVDAANYRGRMLIIHGSQDDNVHPQNTFKLIDELIQNRKQFDLMLYPNKTHGIRGTNAVIHLWTMVFEYMERHLKPSR